MNVNQPQLDDAEWDAEALLRSLDCYTCLEQSYNHWMVCARKAASVNLHLEYLSRFRQTWYVSMLPVKYLVLDGYDGPVFDFGGQLKPRRRDFILKNPILPRDAKKIQFVTYGMYLLVFFPKGETPLTIFYR